MHREQVVADFLRFFEPVGPDLLCFSVLWTGDPTGGALDLRPSGEHTTSSIRAIPAAAATITTT